MKKEYLSPEIRVVMFSMNSHILAASIGGGDDNWGESAIKEYNDVSNDNTTTGGSIWDNEW